MMVRRRTRKKRSRKVVLWLGLAFTLIVTVTLQFVKSAARQAYENEKLKDEMGLVLKRLDGVEASLGQIEQFSQSFDTITETNVKDVAIKTGIDGEVEADQMRESPGFSFRDHVKLYDPEARSNGNFVQLLDRVNELTINANLIAHRIRGLTDVIENRREMLSAIPSVVPTYGRITSGYGYRKSPFTGEKAMHKGIDIAGEHGTPVIAPADGIVSYVGKGRSYGNTVVISHGYGIMTKFAHNSSILVRNGQQIRRGQVISKIGNTGRSTGPHLHYEVWINGKAVDPVRFLLDDDTNKMLAKMAFDRVKKETSTSVATVNTTHEEQLPVDAEAPDSDLAMVEKGTLRSQKMAEIDASNIDALARDAGARYATGGDLDEAEEEATEDLSLSAKALLDSDTDDDSMEFSGYESENGGFLLANVQYAKGLGQGGELLLAEKATGSSELGRLPIPEWETYLNLAIVAGLSLLVALFLLISKREPLPARVVRKDP